MFFPLIIRDYFVWHYTRAWWELWGLWRNMLWFIVHFFSLPELLRSWFAPFKRITERRGNTWDLEDLASYVIIGIISRFIGALIRTFLIFFGIIALIATVGVGMLVYLLWALVPVIIFGLLGASLSLFFISL